MTPISKEQAGLIAREVMRESRGVQERIAAARRALRAADDALVDALADMGVPTRPVSAFPARGRGKES